MKSALLFVAGFALLAGAVHADSASAGIAATVNGEAITVAELDRQTEGWPADKLRERKQQALQVLIDRTLIIQAFYREGIQVPKDYIDGQMNEIVKDEYGGDHAAFERTLAERGITLEKYRQEIANNCIVGYERTHHPRTWQAYLRQTADIKIY